MNDTAVETSEERIRSHVPDAIGLTFHILRLSAVWRTLLERELAERGGSVANMRPLAYLTFLPEGITQRELATAMDIDTSALVRVFDLLEKAGFIRREPDQEDRRLKRIYLTPGGRAAWETFKQTASTLEARLTDGLGEEARALMLKEMDHIIQVAARLRREG